jgi:hypothetical protein
VPSCLRRGSLVTLSVSRAAAVEFFVGRTRIHGLSVRPLQSRVLVGLRRNFTPGRYLVRARVRFERGAGTKPLSLTRVVRICGAARRAPRFTG